MARTIEAPEAAPAREERRRRPWVVSGLVGGAAAALLSALVRRFAPSVPFAPLWIAAVALYPAGPDHVSRGTYALVMLPVFAASGVLAGRSARRFLRRHEEPATDLERRALMRAMWVGGAGLLLGASDVGRI